MSVVPEKIYQNVLHFLPGNFDQRMFADFLGYPAGRKLPPTIQAVLAEKLLPNIGLTPLNHQYRMLPIADRDAHLNTITIPENIRLNGNLVYRLLQGSSHLIVHLISTPGQKVADAAETYIYYAYFNTLLQMAADHLRRELVRNMGIPDIQLTRRYAPGYCGWPIDDQNTLLHLLQPSAIGVRCTDAFMLEPAHSISGIFGLRTGKRIGGDMPCYHCTSLACRVHDDFNKELFLIEGE
jgi:hypothetical protein